MGYYEGSHPEFEGSIILKKNNFAVLVQSADDRGDQVVCSTDVGRFRVAGRSYGSLLIVQPIINFWFLFSLYTLLKRPPFSCGFYFRSYGYLRNEIHSTEIHSLEIHRNSICKIHSEFIDLFVLVFNPRNLLYKWRASGPIAASSNGQRNCKSNGESAAFC